MAESFIERRKRELNQKNGTGESAESFIERRRRELLNGTDEKAQKVLQTTLAGVTKPAPKAETKTQEKKPEAGIDFKAAQAQAKQQPVQQTNAFTEKLPAADLVTGKQTAPVQQQLQGKLPMASAVLQTGGGPANASQIPGISQYEINKKEIEDAPPVIKQYAQAMNYLAEGNPLGIAIGNAFSGNSGATRKDSSGNATVDKVADAINNLVTPIITPTGAPLGQGIIGASYDATGKALSGAAGQKLISGASKLVPFAGKEAAENIARVGVTEGAAGALQGVGVGLQQGQDSGRDIARNAALGVGAGIVGGVAGGVLDEVLRPAASRLTQTADNSILRAAEEAAPTMEAPRAATFTLPKSEAEYQNLFDAIQQGTASGDPVLLQIANDVKSRGGLQTVEELQYIGDNLVSAERRGMTADETLNSMRKFVEDYGPRKVEPAASPEVVTKVKKQSKTSANPEQKTPGIRSNYQTMAESGNISGRLADDIGTLDQTYEIKRNTDTVNRANEKVKADLSQTADNFLSGEITGGADRIATGYRVMQELDKSGEHARALAVADRLAKDLTEAGQTVQAASLISRLSPEGQLLNLIRTAEKNGKTVSVADSVKFKQLAEEVQVNSKAGAQENTVNTILNKLEQGQMVTPEEIKTLGDYLKSAEEKLNVKTKEVKDRIPKEMKDSRKRDKVVSFLEAQEEAARQRIAKRKGRLNSLPVDEWVDYSILIAAKVGKGIIKAETHVEDLVKMFGEEVRPVATKVFEKAQELVNGVSKSAAEGNLIRATSAFRKISGKDDAEAAAVKEMASHVRQLIEESKTGELTKDGVQKLRDYAEEIAEMLKDKPAPIVATAEQKYLQTVKQLAKKIAEVETQKTPRTQDNKEVEDLLRQITKLTDGMPEKVKSDPATAEALSNIAYDVMKVPRPEATPTTLHEKIVAKYLKENPQVSEKDIESLRKLAKSITDLSGDNKIKADMEMQKILNSYEKSSVMDKINALRYMAMLFNSSTQAVNALSGPIMATSGRVFDVFGTMIDSTLSKALKQPRTTTLYNGNPIKFMAEYFKYLKVGAKAGWEGVNPAGIMGANDIRGLTYKSLYNPLSLLERSLGAVSKGADFAAYKAIFNGEMEKQGFLDALENGIKRSDKEAIKRHIRSFINEPSESAIEQADRIAKNATFQRTDTLGGEAANRLNSGQGKVQKYVSPVARTVFPFVRTPINIASSAVSISPAGILKGLLQLADKSNVTQREAIRTLSMGLTGTGLSAMGYYLSQLGIVTGSNDSGDKNVDNIREQSGKGKYRFNTSALQRYVKALLNGEGAEAAEKAAQYQQGDKQFDYNKLQPLAFPLSIGAEFSNLDDKKPAARVVGTASGAAGSLFGMSTLKGVQDVFQPQYGGTQGEKTVGIASRLAESFFKSFSPSILAQEARRQDPVQRKTSYNDGIVADVSSYFKSRTPGLSQSLPANKDTLGQDKKNAPGITGQYLNPYKSEVANYTKAAQFIVDLMERTGDTSIAPKPPEKKVRGRDDNDESVTISIEPKRYEKLQEDIGRGIMERINEMESGTDEELITQLEDIYSEVRKEYMDELKEELGLQTN